MHLTFTILLLPHWHHFLQELLIRNRLVEVTVIREPQKEHSTEQFILAVEYFVHVLVQRVVIDVLFSLHVLQFNELFLLLLEIDSS